MSQKLNSKFNLLIKDLENLDIDDYLCSRDFEVVLTKNNVTEFWQEILSHVKKNKSQFNLDGRSANRDAVEVLRVIFTMHGTNSKIESVLRLIIVSFIEHFQYKCSFTKLKEAVSLSPLNNQTKEQIYLSITANSSLEDEIEEDIKSVKAKSNKANSSSRIFVVHGHNELYKTEVARLLEKFKLKPIILHEQADKGLTIIEKFEQHADVGFAIIILSKDDVGKSITSRTTQPRARQNVVFEFGYFFGRIGRNKVLALYENGVELPSDVSGILYKSLDNSKSWQLEVAKELKSAGYEIDLNILA